MAGRIIGMIPRNFVITLIENHVWYDEGQVGGKHRTTSGVVSAYYRSATIRQTSERHLSEHDSPRKESQENDEDQSYFFNNENDDKGAEMEEQELHYSQDNSKNDQSMNASKKFEPMEKDERNQTMLGFTGERDYEMAPKSENVLHWHHFCSDFYSSERKVEEIVDIAGIFGHKYVDLRPYFIEQPYVVHTTDKLPKCLELFRHMHLRALPVNDPNTGMPVAIITR